VILELIRDVGQNPDFTQLVTLLDMDLSQRYGTLQASYDQFNAIEAVNTVVIAYVDHQAAACGAFKPYDEMTIEIKRMFVRSELRGRGLASKVLRELENWARELGYAHAILETGCKQAEAIGLYHKCGYKQIENYGQYQGMTNSICFRKIL
jgi:GNAT superfamily N-acetyltransferase